MKALGWGAVAAIVGGCAVARPPVAVPPPPPEVAIVPPAPPPKPEDPAIRERADAAVVEAVHKLAELETSCEKEWLESSVVCLPSVFEGFATDYQAYYAEHPDARGETARIDALTRLGGPTSTVPQIAADLARACEDRCRLKRSASLGNAVNEAALSCFKTKAGLDACKVLVKKMSATLRERELEHWSDECYGICDNHKRAARAKAQYEATRPKTPAQAAACRATCERDHAGGWCGTGLLECLGHCTMKGE